MSEQFDNSLLDGVDPSTGSREIPDDGDYNVAISEAEYKSTAKGGKGFQFKFTLLDGNFAGTEVNHWVNIVNNSSQAEQIGRAELKAIMSCAGTEDANDLVGKSVRVRFVGEESTWENKYGVKQFGVNLRAKLFMTTAGKNAKGEDVPDFVATGTPAKQLAAEKRAASSGGRTGGDTKPDTQTQSQTSDGGSSADLDDQIPF